MFTPIKNTKVYEQVIEQIENMIIDGTLKKGDRLPSERELVGHLKVSRTSIREALRALQVMGLIESRQGEGNFIRENFENTLFEPLSVMFMLQGGKPDEIMEVRKIIEVQTANLAAEKINEKQLENLKRIADTFKTSKNEENNVKLDKKFHYEIAQAAGNFLIINILNAMSFLMDAFLKDARRKILVNKENFKALAEQHGRIYGALKLHDSKMASDEMKKHLDFTSKHIKKNM
ncbi:MAG TPA: FadR family transcriptional regulator [Clostridium sp.]|uniref:FadR/GntR family transcriptional regulator n=1 Tax=Clostridium lapidicellarium TaxID=3240931 RepID=A0ABV4DUC6_9CLOT|nr:FadR/GntR family transcriptional regulator [uncultured Clostridium sp.]NLU08724.1 FadR family transcriptional regulator [Clostridiales bacterium]HBC96528.1 FadR family transcriptional regulator [Clostridium sp.]